ncbi:MAG: D-lactate dehydrogenase [Caulobacterales bacterium 68-7]|nr:MAG: D-lactate dehydrogenase [Caulobacterales bacterium 68-7]
MTSPASAFLAQLRAIVGDRHVLTGDQATRPYRTGFRFGSGRCLAVVRPGSLVEQWKLVQACVAANKIVIMQAANTGLTGGSTPDGEGYDRDIVILNTRRLTGIQVIRDGQQVICLPGATLYDLEKTLKPFNREPHSVIGSSCIGASVLGGISNNSGGALIRRGPAYTEMAIYARLGADGQLDLVNHLGVSLGNDPETILDRLQRGDYSPADVDDGAGRRASDDGYAAHVRDIEAETPARFNADPGRLFEASGSAGKLSLFAVRLDTFAKEAETKVFYIGTNDPADLNAIRRDMLAKFPSLPIAGEYIHRDAFDIAARYGKDMFLAIEALGTDRLPSLFALKGRVDAFVGRLPFLPKDLSDRIMQAASHLFPQHLPARMLEYRGRFEHYLMLRMGGEGIEAARAYLSERYPSAAGDFFECTADEARQAFLLRFVTAGAAVRYRAIHGKEVEDIVALDIALRRNDQDWVETLPPELEADITHKLYYGHFFCYVFHQDYVVRKGADPLAIEHAMWKLLDKRGAEYPAEHNVGHLYPAKPALAEFYQSLDPCNAFNPGVGQTTKCEHWKPKWPTFAEAAH